MATGKSVIEIDILDDKFKAFATLFDKFQTALDKMPKGWEAAGKAVDKVGEKTDKTAKKIIKEQKEQNKHANDGLKIVKETARFSGEIAKNFASTAVSVAKWLALGAVGGGFGIGGIAASASDYRVRASGANATTGELRAIQSSLKKYSDDPEALLSKIADMQADRGQTATLNVVGGNRNNTPFQSMIDILKETKRVLSQHKDENGNVDLNIAEALGFTKLFNSSELRRIVNDKGELGGDTAAAETNAKKLSNLDSENKALQDFWMNLIYAKNKIELALIEPLSRLAKPLSDLTDAVVNAISDFLKSDEIKKSIKEFTDWISSDDSKKSISEFFSALGKIAALIGRLAYFLPDLSKPKDTPEGQKAKNGYTYKNGVIDNENPENHIGGTSLIGRILNSQSDSYQRGMAKLNAPERFNNPGDLSSWGNLPKTKLADGNTIVKFETAQQGMQALAEQLKLYMNRDHLSTVRDIMTKYVGANNPRLESAIKNVSASSGLAPTSQLQPTDLYKLMSGITKNENARSNYTPQSIQVMVSSAAGSDLNVSANAMK
jgi:hypothetical protein